MIKLVVLDWNGVLIADTRVCWEADNAVLKAFGGRKISLKDYRDAIAVPSLDFYVANGAKKEKLVANPQKWGQIFHKAYEKRASRVRSQKGARKVLNWLQKRNIKGIIVSNHTTEGIQFQLQRLGWASKVTAVLANSDKTTSLTKAPKLERVKSYLKSNKINATEAVIIGDSPEEIKIGKELGMVTVAFTGGYYATWRLKKENPNFLISNLEEIIGITKQLNQE